MTYKLTPRQVRLHQLYKARRRIEAEIARLRSSEMELPTPKRVECGTDGGYQKHRNNGEVPCDDCKAAHAARERLYYQRRRQARGATI